MRFVHLARASSARGIGASGIRAAATRVGVKGVFCLPVLADFSVTYQWLRELRRWHDERMVAVSFRVAADERVHVGRYNAEHVECTASEAAARVKAKPAGCEVILPRSVRAKEIVAIREMTQLVGWTEKPEKSDWECVCSACIPRGLPDRFRRIRAAYERALGTLRSARTVEERVQALQRVGGVVEWGQRRLDPSRLLSSTRHEDERVRIAVAPLLSYFRWSEVSEPLTKLARDRADIARGAGLVRAAGIQAIVRCIGLRRATALLAGDDWLAAALLVSSAEYSMEAAETRLVTMERAARYDDRKLGRDIMRVARDLLREERADMTPAQIARAEALASGQALTA